MRRSASGSSFKLMAATAACLALLAFLPPVSQAQHGHPLVGTWSGYLNRAEGQPIRALFQFSFGADQVISGSVIANGQRFPITSAALDQEDWTVTLRAQGQDRTGNSVDYRIEGAIENLDSPTERTLAGNWRQGDDSGDFQVVIN